MLLVQSSLFSKVIPHPNGNNGYEDYVRAAEIASTSEFGLYRSWISNLRSPKLATDFERPADVDIQDPDLVVRRKWNDRFRTCCGLISNGNRKQVFDPRETVLPDTTFPELAGFRSVAVLEVNAAHVAFADGQTAEAISHVEDNLVFAFKVGNGGSVLISCLVGVACDNISFTELDDHWSQLSVSDAHELRHFFATMVNGPAPLIECIRGERRAAAAALDTLFGKPGGLLSDYKDDDAATGLINSIAKLNSADMAQLKTDSAGVVARYYDSISEVLAGPESGWIKFKNPPEADMKQPLADRVADLVLPNLSQVLIVEARDRTRMRLAYLNAAAIEFRWVNGRLPDRIEDFTNKVERVDPTSGKNFVYKRHGSWFKIVREAKDALGGVGMQNPPKPPDLDSLPNRA